MPGSIILVRHARPDMSGRQPGTWALTDQGIDDARRLGITLSDLAANGVATVLSSTEPKANETATALGLGDVHPDERLREVERPWYDDEATFSMAARRYLDGVPVADWEPLGDAVSRFGSAVADLDGIAVAVSHGTVMSAWLSRQIPHVDAVSFWDQLRMPDAWLVDADAQTVHRVAEPSGR